MPTTIQADVRAPLAAALAGVTASVYESVPEAIIAPAALIIPGTPYLETTLISSSIQVKINFTIYFCFISHHILFFYFSYRVRLRDNLVVAIKIIDLEEYDKLKFETIS
jgi:hypothetical protein